MDEKKHPDIIISWNQILPLSEMQDLQWRDPHDLTIQLLVSARCLSLLASEDARSQALRDFLSSGVFHQELKVESWFWPHSRPHLALQLAGDLVMPSETPKRPLSFYPLCRVMVALMKACKTWIPYFSFFLLSDRTDYKCVARVSRAGRVADL